MEQKNGNTKKPNILLIHFSAPPVISGVDVMIRDQARMFRLFGYKVEIVAGSGKQFRYDIPLHVIKRISPRHPKVFEIREELEKGIVSKSFYQLENYLYRLFKKYLVNHNISVCVLHNLMIRHYNLPLTSALTRLIADMPQVKFVTWVHDTLFSDNNDSLLEKSFINKFPWTLLTTPVPSLIYICVNRFCEQSLLQTFAKKKPESLLVINNAIDIPKFLGLSPLMRQFYTDIDGRGSDLIALIPVRAVPRKNLELALKIAAEIVAKKVNFKLLLTANVDYKRPEYLAYYHKLQQMVKTLGIEKHVYFMEECFKKYSQKNNLPVIPIAEAYRIADFLLLTSAFDGFGLPLLEAGVTRVPIFASDISSYREIGTTNINYFSLTKSPREIANFILGRLKKMPQAYFYRKVINHYSLLMVFKKQIIPLVEELAPAKSGLN